ncbi:MAG: arsenate reductase, partial [Bdellovibrionota bacterium]
LLALMEILVGDVAGLVRSKEESFRTKPFALDDRRVIAAELAKRPELLERPIIIKGNRAVVARPIERFELLK